MPSVQIFELEEVIEASRLSKDGRIAIRWIEIAWLGMLLMPFFLILFIYAAYSKGLNLISFFYLFRDPSISPAKPILGAIAFIFWLVFVPHRAWPVLFRPRVAVAFRDDRFVFFEREIDAAEVDHFERRIHGLGMLSELVIVLKDGTEISKHESFVRGFPVR